MKMNDMKFTTAEDYMDDVQKHLADNKPTGGETWQTKATAKGKVPRYYSPVELLSMRVDRLEIELTELKRKVG